MPRALVVIGNYYQHISDMLSAGALTALESAGWEYECIYVPGALEIPAVMRRKKDQYQAFVALGCVIRGETSHYDEVCRESARGLMDLAVIYGLAIGNGILTVENENQAIARADIQQGNKGQAAVVAALAVAAVAES